MAVYHAIQRIDTGQYMASCETSVPHWTDYFEDASLTEEHESAARVGLHLEMRPLRFPDAPSIACVVVGVQRDA